MAAKGSGLYTKYNKKEDYLSTIVPLINEIRKLCNDEKIPFFFACPIESTEKRTIYEYDLIGTNPNNIFLYDDKIIDFTNVANGFEVVDRKSVEDIDMDLF